MPMKVQGVRFGESVWELVQREASREGVSGAQFVRDAALMRAMFLVGFRWRSAGHDTGELLTLAIPRIGPDAEEELARFFGEMDEYAAAIARPDEEHWTAEIVHNDPEDDSDEEAVTDGRD